MKYVIILDAPCFGNPNYNEVLGYVNSKESAIFLCEVLNKENEKYYFEIAHEGSSLYRCNLCIEYMVDCLKHSN